MKITVVIVNYNTFALTCNCIASLLAHTRGVEYEIILVDNASVECSPDFFLEKFPAITLVKSEHNGGFAFGNNLGIARAKGDYILLLNSDTVIQEDSISLCANFLSAHPSIGVLGPRMVFPGGKVQYTARRFRSICWELLDLFRFIPWMMPYKKRSQRLLGKYFRHDENRECDWLNGAFFMFPRRLLADLPEEKLDERFFMYGEDQLWCEQIKKLGYKNFFFAGTTIVHVNSGSTALEKQLKWRNTMMKHEREIMRLRKGRGLYYFLFNLIYTFKEGTSNRVKGLVFRLRGKLIR